MTGPLPPLPRPIFVLGAQRSGTTLLRLMLDSHDRIAIGHETGFMRAVKHTKSIPDYEYGDGWYRRYGIDDQKMNALLRDFYGGIFSQHARAQGKQRWGEKTPLNLFQVPEILALFPDAQLVAIVRHAGAVCASLLRWGFDMERALTYWLAASRRLRRMRSSLLAEQFHLCRYEDLVLRPGPTLEGILGFLGESWSDDLLRHHEIQAARGEATVEGGTRANQRLDLSRLDAWHSQLTPEQRVRLTEHKVRTLLRHFGYELDSAIPAD